jgi:HAD superfamily hydrolase (TIGR01549 family)
MKHNIQAIIWDYDGTLVDTRHKNLAVTRKIVERITGRHFTQFPALQSQERYDAVTKVAANWREMYQQQYAMTPEQVDQAGWLWTELQLADTTHVPIFNGIAEALAALQHLPHGIVSQNARSNIVNALKAHDIEQHFGCIIGFEEVDIRQQKPEPEGLLQCIRQLTNGNSGVVLYIGDHETDFRCAHNADQRLQQQKSNVRVISVGACYGCVSTSDHWTLAPEQVIQAPKELIALVGDLNNSSG